MCCHRGVQGLGSALSPLGVCLGVFFAQPPRSGSKVREITEAVLIAACYKHTPTGGESSVLKVSADTRQSSIHLIGVLIFASWCSAVFGILCSPGGQSRNPPDSSVNVAVRKSVSAIRLCGVE